MAEPKEPELQALLDYWHDKRGARSMPARVDIDPTEIPQLLPHVALVETADTLGEFRYRLFGTEVCKGFEHDRTGVRFGDLPKLDNFDDVYDGYWRTYAERTPIYFHGRILSQARNHIAYSRLTLPLSSDGERVDMLLGGFVFFYVSNEPGVPALDNGAAS